MVEPLQDWDAVMLLCDYAEELGGKLYVMGGGWSQLRTAVNDPINIHLAIKLSVPWNQANEPHDLVIRLVKENGEAVKNEDGEDIQLTGRVEVGRPPGLRLGSNLDLPLVARFQGIPLEPGRYHWQLEIDSTSMGSTTFDVIQVP